ncbi:Transcriptional regulator of ribosomal biogenesis proteins, partial [Spiromyces aspiralis]
MSASSPSSVSLDSGLQSPAAFDDSAYTHDIESSFCRDFTCCGLLLNDLHDLLQHYEECHVRFEDDDHQPEVTDDLLFDNEWSSLNSSD